MKVPVPVRLPYAGRGLYAAPLQQKIPGGMLAALQDTSPQTQPDAPTNRVWCGFLFSSILSCLSELFVDSPGRYHPMTCVDKPLPKSGHTRCLPCHAEKEQATFLLERAAVKPTKLQRCPWAPGVNESNSRGHK